MYNKFEELENGILKTEINNLAKSIGFPLKKILIMDGSKRSAHSNAYFFGFWKNKRIVIFDTLIRNLNLQEIIAVIGHELGHWKYKHVFWNLFIFMVIKLIILILIILILFKFSVHIFIIYYYFIFLILFIFFFFLH